MNLIDLVKRQRPPAPWAEGDKIPWDDPDFSRRMLAEHLSQAHDHASRRSEIIEQHVGWIHQYLLGGRPSQVLDLGCGPGLYTSRLARLGHRCLGIDYSPASIAYARATAQAEGLACDYQQTDIRRADFGQGHDLAMLIFGELNAFRRAEAQSIVARAYQALAPGGQWLMEVSSAEEVQGLGEAPARWYSAASGLYSDQPHLVLHESFWDSALRAATQRYCVVDAASGAVTRHVECLQAYSLAEYRALLEQAGFGQVTLSPAGDDEAQWPGKFVLLAARK